MGVGGAVTDSWELARSDHRSRRSDAIAHAALSLLLTRGAPALTMAALAEAAGVSRQTLYRYFPDLDAVLVGVAGLVASHDDDLEVRVRAAGDPADRLDALVGIVAGAEHHDDMDVAALRAALPPAARDVLATHEQRVGRLLAEILQDGIEQGVFRTDIEPARDAAPILGLATARPSDPERARTFVHRIVDPQEDPA